MVRETMTTARAAMSDVARSTTVVRKKLLPELPRSSRSHCLSSSGEGLVVVLGETESSQISTEGRGLGAPRASRRRPSRGIEFGVCLGWIPVADSLFRSWRGIGATQHIWASQVEVGTAIPTVAGTGSTSGVHGFGEQRDALLKRKEKGRASRRRNEDCPASVPKSQNAPRRLGATGDGFTIEYWFVC
jgi:hypothetical protein